MNFILRSGLLIGLGIVAGVAGTKCSETPKAREICIQGLAKGMTIQSICEEKLEQAKAEIDDIVAEAKYVKEQNDAEKKNAASITKEEIIDVVIAQDLDQAE